MKFNSSFLLILSYTFLVFGCEKEEYRYRENSNYFVHCLLIEGEAPKLMVSYSSDVFPKDSYNEYFPFDVVFFPTINFDGNNNFVMKRDGEVLTGYTDTSFNLQELYWNEDNVSEHNWPNYIINENIEIKPEEEFELEINLDNWDGSYKTLKSKTHIPKRVDFELKQLSDSMPKEGQYYHTPFISKRVQFSFNDTPNENNYYYLLAYELVLDPGNIDSTCQELYDLEDVELDSLFYKEYNLDCGYWGASVYNEFNSGLEPYVELYSGKYPGVLINDELFDGKKKDIIFHLFSNDTDDKTYFFVELYHVSEEFYRYHYSLQMQVNSKKDVYSEPAQIYSNIENGLGIFAGASVSKKMIKIESKPN